MEKVYNVSVIFMVLCWQRLLTVGIVECVNHLYDFAQLWF